MEKENQTFMEESVNKLERENKNIVKESLVEIGTVRGKMG